MDIPSLLISDLKQEVEPTDYEGSARKVALKKLLFAIKHDKVEMLEEAFNELDTIKGEMHDPANRYGPEE